MKILPEVDSLQELSKVVSSSSILSNTILVEASSNIIQYEFSSTTSLDNDSSNDLSSIEIIRAKDINGANSTISSPDLLDEDSSSKLEFISSSFESWINSLGYLNISSFLDSS